MFGELPKLFDRDFAIAYFLPSAGFVAITYFFAAHFNLTSVLFDFSKESFLKDITSFGLLALLGAIILLVANRSLVRLMEGYWAFNLKQHFNWIEVRRYKELLAKEKRSDEEKMNYSDSNPYPRELQAERNQIKSKKAERFPDGEHLILPTSFGNTFRAFEVYSRVMYGIDAIPGWYRLLAVIPADYKNLINAARAQVDFWVNVWFLSLIIIIEYLIIVVLVRPINFQTVFSAETLIWLPIAAIVSSYIAFRLATNAARTWGNWVKAAFDVYLPELRKKLEISLPKNNEQEREIWKNFSKAVIYRDAYRMPEKTTTPSETKPDSTKDFSTSLERNIEHLLVFKTALKILEENSLSKKDGS